MADHNSMFAQSKDNAKIIINIGHGQFKCVLLVHAELPFSNASLIPSDVTIYSGAIKQETMPTSWCMMTTESINEDCSHTNNYPGKHHPITQCFNAYCGAGQRLLQANKITRNWPLRYTLRLLIRCLYLMDCKSSR